MGLFEEDGGGGCLYCGCSEEEDTIDKGLDGVVSYCEPGLGGGRGLEDVEGSGRVVRGVIDCGFVVPGGGFAYKGGSREKCSCMISSSSLRLQPYNTRYFRLTEQSEPSTSLLRSQRSMYGNEHLPLGSTLLLALTSMSLVGTT